jgi:hypothetical protein
MLETLKRYLVPIDASQAMARHLTSDQTVEGLIPFIYPIYMGKYIPKTPADPISVSVLFNFLPYVRHFILQ